MYVLEAAGNTQEVKNMKTCYGISKQYMYASCLCLFSTQEEAVEQKADGGGLLAAYCVHFVNRLTKQRQTWPEETCLL